MVYNAKARAPLRKRDCGAHPEESCGRKVGRKGLCRRRGCGAAVGPSWCYATLVGTESKGAPLQYPPHSHHTAKRAFLAEVVYLRMNHGTRRAGTRLTTVQNSRALSQSYFYY